MAVYKVIQDIEAEDKLLGPLTFKGLVYAIIAATLAFINFKLLLATSLGPVRWIFILLFAMPMILFGVLASPLGRDQPTEVWLLARVRFLTKPRMRIWNQMGITNLVTITVPKKIERQLTKGLSQTEVQSRLQALATTLDSRGWVVKHVDVNLNNYAGYFQNQADSDRLVGTENVLKEVPITDVRASDDILDAQNNPTAQKFETLIEQAENSRRQEVQDSLQTQRQKEPEYRKHSHREEIHDIKPMRGPLHKSPRQDSDHPQWNIKKIDKASHEAAPAMTLSNQAAKLELANSGNDLSVASISSLVNHKADAQPGEVSIALH
jgi:hypothetical protein